MGLHNVIARCYISSMKRRYPPLSSPPSGREPGREPDFPGGPGGLGGLLEAIQSLRNTDELHAFLQDLCTPAEIEALADRWRVVPLLLADRPYREIHDLTGVSVTTIGRVARCLGFGAGGYRTAVERLGLSHANTVAGDAAAADPHSH